MQVLTFKAPPELADALRRLAQNSDRSISAEIRVAVKSHIAQTAGPTAVRRGGAA